MANKKQEPIDHARELEVAREMGRSGIAQELEQTKQKLAAAQQIFTAAGHIQALNFTEAQAAFFKVVKLKQLKESKDYWEKYGMTWVQFCEYCGINWRAIDRKIAELGVLRQDFLQTLVNLSGVTFNKIKYLGMESSDNLVNSDRSLVEFKGNDLFFAGEAVPMEKEAINAVLDRLEITYKDQIAAQKKEADKLAKGLEGQLKEAATEKKALLGRVHELEPFEPKDLDEAAVKTFAAVDEYLKKADNALRAWVFKADDLSDDAVARINSILNRMKDRVELFDQNWTAQLTGDE